jgi:hypothetical protein
MMPSPTHSSGEKMPDISSLTAEIDRLTRSVSFWNSAIIVLMIGVAAVATGLVIAQQMAFRKADALAKATGQLSTVKEALANQNIAEALRQAGESNKAAGEANERAGKAQASLASAEQEAAEANTKAEGFRLDIAKANQASSEAQAQVAGATAEAAKANLELVKLKTPRTLTNAPVLTDALKTFKGTEYTIIGCFQDQDSINLLVQLDKVLTDAGWTRKLPPQNSFGDLRLNISKDFAVPIATRSGVYVGAQSAETVDALKATPQRLLPGYIRAAMALKGGLASGINPPEGDFGPLPVDPGDSTAVFIIVGKKP